VGTIHEFELWQVALSRLGDYRMPALAASKTVASATAANPVVCTSTAHGFAQGDLVLITDMDQMTQVNGRVFRVGAVAANTFELENEDGTAYTAETGGGLARKLPAAKAAFACFEVWSDVRDEVLRDHPWNCASKATRLARLQAAKTITGATAANPVVITSVAHGYSSADQVLLENLGGMVEVNDRYFSIIVLTANTFSIGVDGTLFTAYTSGGTAKKALTPIQADFGLKNIFTLPSDFVRVLEMPEDTTDDYRIRGQLLYTDAGITVPLYYVRRETDLRKWDPLLVSAMEARLALELSELLTQSNSKKEALLGDYERVLGRAKSADGQEQTPSEFATDVYITSRF